MPLYVKWKCTIHEDTCLLGESEMSEADTAWNKVRMSRRRIILADDRSQRPTI